MEPRGRRSCFSLARAPVCQDRIFHPEGGNVPLFTAPEEEYDLKPRGHLRLPARIDSRIL